MFIFHFHGGCLLTVLRLCSTSTKSSATTSLLDRLTSTSAYVSSLYSLQSAANPHQWACGLIPSVVSFASSDLWSIMGTRTLFLFPHILALTFTSSTIGEWSNSPTDCAQWLNGRGVGARWDGTWPGSEGQGLGSCSNWTGNYTGFPSNYTAFLRQ